MEGECYKCESVMPDWWAGCQECGFFSYDQNEIIYTDPTGKDWSRKEVQEAGGMAAVRVKTCKPSPILTFSADDDESWWEEKLRREENNTQDLNDHVNNTLLESVGAI